MNIARILQSNLCSAPFLALLVLSGGTAACASPASSDGVASSPLATASPFDVADDCAATKNEDGWCWGATNHPMGQLQNFFVVGDNDVWASTSTEVLAHWDGQRWNPVKIGDRLQYVWGFSGSDIWAAGAVLHEGQKSTGVIYHYDGATWTKAFEAPEMVDRIWGIAPNDVWGAGWHNGTWHWDGTSWTQVGTIRPISGGSADKVDGTASKDVWRVATTGVPEENITHWDGTQWTKVEPPSELRFVGMETVRALAKNDVWFGGTRRLLRYNGSTWSQVQLPGLPENGQWAVTAITGTARDLYFGVRSTDINGGGAGALFRWNGSRVEAIALPESLERSLAPTVHALERTSLGTLWLARGIGDIYRRTGNAFTRTSSGPQIDFDAAASNGSGLAASGLSGSVAFFENGVWSSRLANPERVTLSGLAMPQPGITLAASANSFVRFEGSGAAQLTQPFDPSSVSYVSAVSAPAADDVWVARGGGIWHLLGSSWSKIKGPGGYVSKVYAPARREVYAVTSEGAFRYDGAFWQKVWSHPTKEILKAADGSLWGLVERDYGGATSFIHDGQLVSTGDEDLDYESAYLQALTACPDGRLYGVRPLLHTKVMSYQNGTWKQEVTSASQGLSAVTCMSDGTVWAFGEDGTIVKKPAP